MFPSWTSVHYKVRLCQKFNCRTPLTDQDFSHETILSLTDGKQLNLTQMFEKRMVSGPQKLSHRSERSELDERLSCCKPLTIYIAVAQDNNGERGYETTSLFAFWKWKDKVWRTNRFQKKSMKELSAKSISG